MKIVYVVPYGVILPSRAAHSINIMSMCSALSDHGHKVTLILPDAIEPNVDLFTYYGIKNNFSIQFVKRISNRWFYPFYSLLTLLEIISIKPDLVVGRSALSCLFAAWTGYQVIFDSHGPAWSGSKVNRLIYLLLIGSKNLKKMTVNSNALRNIYLESGIAPKCPIVVAHNGSFKYSLDDKISKWPGKSGLQIGYAGHLYKGRGIELIIGCALELPQFDFHIVGGSEEDILYWSKLHNLSNLYFHGFVSPSEVYKYRNMCDILLAPYMKSGVLSASGKDDSSKYMNPIKLIEYMASKKAIIASDLPPIREVLNNSNAVLLNTTDVEEWVQAILRLESPESRKMLAENAYKEFGENLTWSARAGKLVN